MPAPLIIDTDIGSDIDDAIAIAYAVLAGMDVKLITTVHGDTALRAKIAKKLTTLLGADIHVAAGEGMPIRQKHIFTTGLEGKDFVSSSEKLDVRYDGVDALADAVYTNPGSEIASIGPMTNIARAFERYPDLPSRISCIYVMGNAIVRPTEYILNYRAHNFKVDPESVDIVFAADVPKVIVPTDVCKKSNFSRVELEQLKGRGPALDYISRAALEWLDFIGYDCAYLYDPLVVHHNRDCGVTSKMSYGKDSVAIDVDKLFKEKVLKTLTGVRT